MAFVFLSNSFTTPQKQIFRACFYNTYALSKGCSFFYISDGVDLIFLFRYHRYCSLENKELPRKNFSFCKCDKCEIR